MREKNKKTVSIIGHYQSGTNQLSGQIVKTEIITDALLSFFTNQEVVKIDTQGNKYLCLLKSPFQALFAMKKSRNVVILPAQNGLRVVAPLLIFLKKFFKNRRLHYVVIGGWLPEFLTDKPKLAKRLKKFDYIYVETNTMKKALEEQGFSNIVIMPNCKNLKILDRSELVYPESEPLKLCTFSRVMKEKGIEDAVNAVKEVNEKIGRTVYSLDIYGQVDQNQIQWFNELKNGFPDYIKYAGLVDYDKSVDVLKNYFALMFPTHFYTEGIPGTIIDAYSAGVPVVSAKWESFSDIVDDGITGFGYDFDNYNAFLEKLEYISQNIEKWNSLKFNCIKKAKEYQPDEAIRILSSRC